jgi:hypothetical protein
MHLASRSAVGTIARMPARHVLALSLIALVEGCGHDDAPPSPACGDPSRLSLPNCAADPDQFSDEACTVLDDAIASRASTQDARAAEVMAPTEAQRLPRATPFAFAWTAPTARRGPLRAPRAMTLADEMRRWTTLLPEAEAHCEPFSGRAYELRFRVDGATVFRRQQSTTRWMPDAHDWAILVAAGGGHTVELTVFTALFNRGVVGTGAGPFSAMASRRFTLE